MTNWRQGGSTSSARGGSAGGEIEVVLNDDVDVLKFTDEDMTDIRTQIEIGDKVRKAIEKKESKVMFLHWSRCHLTFSLQDVTRAGNEPEM